MQGMMMSERPASIATGMVDSSISIGNYKGVMLCNRPFAGASQGAAAAASGGPATQQFAAGKVPEPLGLNRQRSDVVKVKRTKKETALTRHRKWLADLQKTQAAAEKAHQQEAQAKDDSKRRFMEREAKMRTMAKNAKLEAKELALADAKAAAASPLPTGSVSTSTSAAAADAGSLASTSAGSESKEGDSVAGAEAKGESSTSASALEAAAKKRAKMGKAAKPMWALTEDKAVEATLEAEEEELDELLDFAKNLDFEKYIGDMEITTMMDQVKKRIAELEQLETDEDVERFEQQRGENRPMNMLTADKISALQKKYGVEEEAKDEDDETRSVALSVLSENKELGNIHSTASISALAAKSKATAAGTTPFAKDFPENSGGGLNETAMPPPSIAKNTVDQGTRLSNKNTIQNLPYMHRNPSV